MAFSPTLASNDGSTPGLFKLERQKGNKTIISWWVRPEVHGKRVWRKLKALSAGPAWKEAETKLGLHAKFLAGEAIRSPFQESERTFKTIAALYLAAGCPHTRKHLPRNQHFCDGERQRIEWLNKFFGDRNADDIRLPLLAKHAAWRREQITMAYMGEERATGDRVIELEWVTLSNVISFGVYHGMVDFNHIRQQRPVLRVDDPESTTASRIRHSREVAPSSGDMVHQVARELLKDERSQPTGWLWLFASLTGLRRGELLSLRLDARPPAQQDGIGEPGWVDDRRLHVKRQKRSRIHWVLLYPELSALLSAHFRWHQAYAPSNPYYFPGKVPGKPLYPDTITGCLPNVCDRLKLPRLTIHGARSYFTTVLRSQGLGDAQIAARVGDSTVELIQDTYGSIPGNWQGQAALSFLPSNGEPAWEPWNALKPASPVAV